MQGSSDRSKQLRQEPGEKATGKKGETPKVLITLPTIADSIAENHGLHKDVIRAVLDDCISMISYALVNDCKVRIENFGSLRLKQTRSHLGDCAKVSFKMGRRLKIMAHEARGES